MGGVLETVSDNEDIDEDLSDNSYVRVRFGFRRYANNRVCLAALRYDVEDLPKRIFSYGAEICSMTQNSLRMILPLSVGSVDTWKALGKLKMVLGFK
jgi:hypothetical protein